MRAARARARRRRRAALTRCSNRAPAAGELMVVAEPFLQRKMHPTVIVNGYYSALDKALKVCESLAVKVDLEDRDQMQRIVQSSIGTKFVSRFGEKICNMAIDAVLTVSQVVNGKKEVDIKRYAKVEKVRSSAAPSPPAAPSQSYPPSLLLLPDPRRRPGGVPRDGRRHVQQGRGAPQDAPPHRAPARPPPRLHPRVQEGGEPDQRGGDQRGGLEHAAQDGGGAPGEAVRRHHRPQGARALLPSPPYPPSVVADTPAPYPSPHPQPDLVIAEKGVADLAQHYLAKANISVIRRIRKTDNNRVARITGATIVNRTDEITVRRRCSALAAVMWREPPLTSLPAPSHPTRVQEEDIGTKCGLFEIRKVGDEYFTFMEQCDDPKACSIVLRGASKDVLNEIERNLQDAMQVARNIVFNPRLLPGGGATEMAVSQALLEGAKSVDGIKQWPFAAVGHAMEVIPRTLTQNCGADTVRLITALRVRCRCRRRRRRARTLTRCLAGDAWGPAGQARRRRELLGRGRRAGRVGGHAGGRRVGRLRGQGADAEDVHRVRLHAAPHRRHRLRVVQEAVGAALGLRRGGDQAGPRDCHEAASRRAVRA